MTSDLSYVPNPYIARLNTEHLMGRPVWVESESKAESATLGVPVTYQV
ncbi:MAG: hypothetical protein ETSY2_14005 [Candidatus Entotheonella gemina]|uniref:Uncharacterized protein n=1 Tax=Candidatus Entotheonella gemina TaxID=1429439 RepID=W4M9V7_9BACT|nr:MAG: hypothetical protein ETSY2_14005 [Candidatus Entotheonella gemina]